jgi:class 3 adenylate cyclase
MPYYMDRHELAGMTAEQIAEAHVLDLQVQGQFGVQFITYWFDPEHQLAFCLATGPSPESVSAAHAASHGLIGTQVIEVDGAAVSRFLGGFVERPAGEPYVETAFRVIMFTDLEGSTSLTQQLGDARAMSVVRRHDEIVRAALGARGGTEVKHTGDGLMASFRSVGSALEAAIQIQHSLAEAEKNGEMPVGVRIGIAAGEPVTESDDLFGTAVQMAARLTARAQARTILVSAAVRDLAHGKGFKFGPPRSVRLKGFGEAVRTCEVVWAG